MLGPNFCCTWCEIAVMAEWVWRQRKKKLRVKTKQKTLFCTQIIYFNRQFATASLIHQWIFLFATNVVKKSFTTLVLFYSPTSTFILPLLCCSHYHWRPVVHPTHKMWSLLHFILYFTTPVMLVCMCNVFTPQFVHVAFDTRDRLLFEKKIKTLWPLLPPFPCLSFAGFLNFVPFLYLVLSLLTV